MLKCLYHQWQKPRRHRHRSAAPVAWCQRRSPWIPLPYPWMSADASWPCFAHETSLSGDIQGSLSTVALSQLITTDSGSFPLVIVTALWNIELGILLINTNNTPHCLFWESILHTLVISGEKPTHCWCKHIPVPCQQSIILWLRLHYICCDFFQEKIIQMSKMYHYVKVNFLRHKFTAKLLIHHSFIIISLLNTGLAHRL